MVIMSWENILKELNPREIAEAKEFAPEEMKKEASPILTKLDKKQRRALKKTLQSAEPTEYFGQDFTKLGELLDMMQALDLVKADKKLNKRMETMSEQNVDIVAMASKLRKSYETLYRQIRGIVYPKSKDTLRDEK
tara:strand:- start:206 stop:613 length:408 start_codon:yes stop_codon:yes gene_type:complete